MRIKIMTGETYLTVPEAARIASMADETLRRAIRTGYLRATTPAAGPGRGKFRIARSELDRWIRGEPDTTDYLLQSPANAARLLEAVHDHRAGRNLQERELLPDVD